MWTYLSRPLYKNTFKLYVNKSLFSIPVLLVTARKPILTNIRKTMHLFSVIDVIEKHVPKHLAEKWDNTGLLIEPDKELSVSTILFTNDLTEDIMKEALSANANLILSYHPPLFKPMKTFLCKNWKDRIAMQCISNKIAVYSPHTACDAVLGGVNDWLLKCFDLKDSKPIIPSTDFFHCVLECAVTSEAYLLQALSSVSNFKILFKKPYEDKLHVKMLFSKQSKVEILPLLSEFPNIEVFLIQDCTHPKTAADTGMGRIGVLSKPLKLDDCIKITKNHIGLEHLRVVLGLNKTIDSQVLTIAVCAGSGSSVLNNIAADLYITGEMSHHDLLDVRHRGTSVILCEHSNSERGYLKQLVHQLMPHLPGLKLIISSVDKDPVTII